MSEPTYKKPKETINSDEIFDLVFKEPSVKYGLQQFSNDILNKINAFDKEPGKIYIHCLKRYKDILIYDKDKKRTSPEEVIRQLWLIKLTQEYKYPLDRIEVEKPTAFGREVHEKKADIVLCKEDKITPFIIFELKQPDAKKAEEQLKSYLSAEGSEGGIFDAPGKIKLDDDLDEITEAFVKFAKEQKFSFGR